jgi:DNA-binding response OmpR family regulator
MLAPRLKASNVNGSAAPDVALGPGGAGIRTEVAQATPQAATARAQRILVVDDDGNLLRLLAMILRLAGYDVVTTEDPQRGLDLAGSERPDLIILDLQMPKLDGKAVYRQLRSRGLQTPVLIASAFGAREAQLELGAQAAMEKPFDPDRLVETVRDLLAAFAG